MLPGPTQHLNHRTEKVTCHTYLVAIITEIRKLNETQCRSFRISLSPAADQGPSLQWASRCQLVQASSSPRGTWLPCTEQLKILRKIFNYCGWESTILIKSCVFPALLFFLGASRWARQAGAHELGRFWCRECIFIPMNTAGTEGRGGVDRSLPFKGENAFI